MSKIEEQLKEATAAVAELREKLLPKAEAALKEAKAAGDMTAENKAVVDKLLAEANEAALKEAKLQGKIEAIESGLLDVSQAVAAASGLGQNGRAETFGAKLAGSDELKNYVANGQRGNMVFKVENVITTGAGSADGIIYPTEEQQIVGIARQSLTILDLVARASTSSNAINYPRQTTRTNSAAPTAETAASPESSYGYTKEVANVKKISHVTHLSEEAVDDATQLQGEVDNEMRYGLALAVESQVLSGDGVGENLSGLITNATAFSAPAGIPNATRIDRLRLGMLQVALANYFADGIAMHPTDWTGIELHKDTQNRYVYGDPSRQLTPVLWGLPVVPSLSMAVGEWLTGAMKMAATFYDRKQAEVLISSEHGDNFVEGLLTMKCSMRGALAVKRPSALVTGDFTFA